MNTNMIMKANQHIESINTLNGILMKHSILHKYFLLIALMLCSIAGMEVCGTESIIKTIDFSTWGDQTINPSTTSTAASTTINDVTFLSKSSKSFSIAGGVMTWCDNNMSSSSYYIGIPISDLNDSVIIYLYNGTDFVPCKYLLKDGETSFSASIGSSGVSASANPTKIKVSNSSAYLYLGRSSSSSTMITKIVIATNSSCTAETPTAPTVSSASVCAGTGLTFTSGGTAASGQTWYWQTSAAGTAMTSVSTTPYALSTTGLSGTQTMYLRSTCDGGTTWGTASSISSTVNSSTLSGPSSVAIGSTITLTPSSTGGTWSSSDNNVATVNDGTVTGVAAGPAAITYTDANGCVATKDISVTCAVPSVTAGNLNAATYQKNATSVTALSVSTSAAPQWQSSTDGGTTWTDISGATVNTYTPSVTSGGITKYRCMVTSGTCSAYSDVATISVYDPLWVTISATGSTTSLANATGSFSFTLENSGTVDVPISSIGITTTSGTVNSGTCTSSCSSVPANSSSTVMVGYTAGTENGTFTITVTPAGGSVLTRSETLTITTGSSSTPPTVTSSCGNASGAISWSGVTDDHWQVRVLGAEVTDTYMWSSGVTNTCSSPNITVTAKSTDHSTQPSNGKIQSMTFTANTGYVYKSLNLFGKIEEGTYTTSWDGAAATSVTQSGGDNSSRANTCYTLNPTSTFGSTFVLTTTQSNYDTYGFYPRNGIAVLSPYTDYSSTSTSMTASNLGMTTVGITYTVYVRPINASGSATADWGMGTYTAAVPDPASFTATAGVENAILNWTAASGATGYKVEYKKNFESTWTTFNSSIATTSATISGLTGNTAYDFRVSSVPFCSASNNYITATATPLALVAPTATTATDVSISSFTANWTAPASVPANYTYTVTVYDASNAVVKTIAGISSSSLSASVTGLTSSVTYHYTVDLVETTSSNFATSSSVSVTTTDAVALTLKMVDLTGAAVAGTVSYAGTAYSAGTVNVAKDASSSLTANPPSTGSYAFIKWMVDGVTSTTNPYTATFTTPKTLTAVYSALHCDSTYDLSVNSTMLHTTMPAHGWTVTNLNGYSSGYEWFKYSGTSVKSPTIDRLAKVVVGGVHIKSYSSSSTYSVKFNIVALLDNGTEETVYSRTMYRNVETDYSNPQDAVAYMPSNAIAFRVETPSSSSGSSDVNVGINRITYCTSDSIDNTAPKLYYDPYNTETDVAIAKVPVLKFSEPIYVLNGGSLVKATALDFTTNNVAIYKYNSATSTYDESINLATGITDWGVTTAARDSMLLGSDTLKLAHSTAFAYSTKYKIALKDSVFFDAAGNVITSAYSVFTTAGKPLARKQFLNENLEVIADSSAFSMGTLVHGEALYKTIYLTNVGTSSMTVYLNATGAGTTCLDGTYRAISTQFSISSISKRTSSSTTTPLLNSGSVSLSPGDTLAVIVKFTKQPSNGNFVGRLIINNNGFVSSGDVNINGTSYFDLTAIQAAFMLPYTYESGLTTPIYTNQLIQDYTSVSDIPEEITINGEVPKNGYNFYSNYKVFAAEGGCMVNGNSALRVGKQSSTVDNRLHIQSSAYKGVGNITLSWSATGVRKVKIYSGTSGTVYYQSPSWEAASTCHQTSVNVNNCSEGKVDLFVEFDGVEDSMLTTLYYMHIDTCSTNQNTDAYIFAFEDNNHDVGRVYSGAEGGEDNHIYVSSTNCADGEGASAVLAASVITVSPNATVSPAVGASATIKSETGSDGTVSYYFPYTVTSQDRQHSRTYKVYVDCVKPDATQCYENTAKINVENVSANDSIQILEMRSATCTIPVKGSYTIHYFNEDSIDAHPYVYSIYPVGSSQTAADGYYYLCTNQTQEFGLKILDSNKKEVTPNNATYRWTILKNNDANVTLVNGKDSIGVSDGKEYSYYDGTTAFIKAPSVLPSSSENSISVSITLSLSFGSKCVFLSSDTAHAKIKVTEADPDIIKAVTAECMTGSKLIITATMPTTGVPATGWSWAVYSSDEKTNYSVMNRDENVATIELNNTAPDLIAYVTANGCGTKVVKSAALPVNYASDSTTWIGTTSTDWLTQSNWTRRVPWSCTDVTINPVSVAPNYPVIDRAKADSAACHRILFRPEAGVLNLDVLDYDSAFVQTKLSRNKWYSMTAPLKSMYSGDFYMQGNPLTYMRLFKPGTPKTSTWTATFSDLLQELTPGEGFAYEISGNGYDRSGTSVKMYSSASSDFTLQFPRTTLEGGTNKSMDAKIISYVVPFSKFSGKLLTAFSDTLARTKPYRFSMENENNKMVSKTIRLSNGYNLIANPMMTHLDIGAFLSANSTIIGSVIWKWNGKSSSSVIYNGSDYSVTSAAQPTEKGIVGYYIPPMQSFIVSTTGGDVTIDPATMFAAATSGSPTLKSTSSADEYQRIYVTSTKGDLTTSMMIGKNANATNGYDENYDAHKLFSPYVGEQATPYPYAKEEIYTIVDGEQLDINQFKTSPYVVPVNMTLYGTKDTVTIKVSGADSFVNDKIELVNVATGESQDLKDNNSYVFAYDSTTAAGALFINISPLQNVVTGVNNGATSGSISVFVKSGNTIRVVSAVVTDPIVTVSLYDLSGRLVSQNTNINATVFDKQMNDGQRPYVVKVQTLNSDKVQKVFIK